MGYLSTWLLVLTGWHSTFWGCNFGHSPFSLFLVSTKLKLNSTPRETSVSAKCYIMSTSLSFTFVKVVELSLCPYPHLHTSATSSVLPSTSSNTLLLSFERVMGYMWAYLLLLWSQIEYQVEALNLFLTIGEHLTDRCELSPQGRQSAWPTAERKTVCSDSTWRA